MDNKAFLVIGLAFGDEGKGASCDYLARKHNAKLVVRFNGGPQAAHNVMTPDGRHHTFQQFGSGTFAGARTHISRFMLIDPIIMNTEVRDLQYKGIEDPYSLLTVEGRSLVITTYQRALGRLLELSRGADRHGSCGIGVGQTRSDHIKYGNDVLFADDLHDENRTFNALEFLRSKAREVVASIKDILPNTEQVKNELAIVNDEAAILWYISKYKAWAGRVNVVDSGWLPYHLEGTVIFEGAQGVMLDETHGTAPYNTWTDTTLNNAKTLLRECLYDGEVVRMGCLRPYYTRHGAGPFPTEDLELSKKLREPHNKPGVFQGGMRYGYFDEQLAKKAIQIVGGVDEISMSCVDHLPWIYKQGEAGISLEYIESRLGAPITIVGSGPKSTHRRERLRYAEVHESCPGLVAA